VRAVIQDQYGSPDLLRIDEVDRPVPGPGQVLVRVHGASVHADVWHMVRGVPLALRVMGAGVRRPTVRIPGTDMAGVVEGVGPATERFQVGDRVFGEVIEGFQWRNGATFAEYVAVDEDRLEPVPSGVDLLAAAALPTSGLIALFTVRQEVQVQAGERVLVNGAAGGVGQMCAQIARADGAHVTGVERTDRLDLLEEVGVDEVIDGTRTDYTTGTAGPGRYEVVIDIPGNRPYSAARRVLADGGRYALVGHDRYGAGGHRWLGSIPRVAGLMARSLVDRSLPRPDFSGPAPGSMHDLAELVASQAVRPVIGATYPLAQAPAAVAHLESGRARGKVVLQVAGSS